jgi:hypothetical protein
MRILTALILFMFFVATTSHAAPSPSQKMRPYAGIGILLVPINGAAPAEPLPLYEEPALSRTGILNKANLPAFEWIFGVSSTVQPVVVIARKGSWLKVAYDDAGREAWLNPPRHFDVQTWDTFFKGHVSWLLPGLQKKYYQAFQQPGASPVAMLKVKQPFRVLKLEDDWALVLIEQNSLGWVRWKDEDGRLLIGIATETEVRKP